MKFLALTLGLLSTASLFAIEFSPLLPAPMPLIPQGSGTFQMEVSGTTSTSAYGSLRPAGTTKRVCSAYADGGDLNSGFIGILLPGMQKTDVNEIEFSLGDSLKVNEGVYIKRIPLISSGALCRRSPFLDNVVKTLTVTNDKVSISLSYRCARKEITRTYSCQF